MAESNRGVRLDLAVARLGLVESRSQAESYIRLGRVTVNNRIVTKPGFFVRDLSQIKLNQDEQFRFYWQGRIGCRLVNGWVY